METFASQVQDDLNTGNYSRVLIDLRNNGGGSDGVIWRIATPSGAPPGRSWPWILQILA